ncbi:MAG: hypothetical protein QM539_04180 [Alphaproteobacteria bacterium]|nr:hypothetical protein [Alphaproteobacteria bacterium]
MSIKKIVFRTLLLGVIVALFIYLYFFVYQKYNHRNPNNETALIVKLPDFVKAYQNNETNANTIYLNKVVQVEGNIATIETNQQQQQVIVLQNPDDPFMSVSCTLQKSETAKVAEGQYVKLKGICQGALTDVVITEGIVVKD